MPKRRARKMWARPGRAVLPENRLDVIPGFNQAFNLLVDEIIERQARGVDSSITWCRRRLLELVPSARASLVANQLERAMADDRAVRDWEDRTDGPIPTKFDFGHMTDAELSSAVAAIAEESRAGGGGDEAGAPPSGEGVEPSPASP